MKYILLVAKKASHEHWLLEENNGKMFCGICNSRLEIYAPVLRKRFTTNLQSWDKNFDLKEASNWICLNCINGENPTLSNYLPFFLKAKKLDDAITEAEPIVLASFV